MQAQSLSVTSFGQPDDFCLECDSNLPVYYCDQCEGCEHCCDCESDALDDNGHPLV